MEINVPIHSFPISFTLPWEGRELSSGEGTGRVRGGYGKGTTDLRLASLGRCLVP